MNPTPLRGSLTHCVRSARVIGKPLGGRSGQPEFFDRSQLFSRMPIPIKSQEVNRFPGRAKWLVIHVILLVTGGALLLRNFNQFEDARPHLIAVLSCWFLAGCAWVQAQTLKSRKWGFIALASFFIYPMLVIVTWNRSVRFGSLTLIASVGCALYSAYRFWVPAEK
jgi:hypothetical protein